MIKYNTIIIEDEKNNLELLSYFIGKFCPSINIVAKGKNIEEAKTIFNNYSPQIALLDIQLNDDKIFSLLEEIDISDIEIIFITAYDEYAIKAFKYNAVDYVLKPISIEDFVTSINKAILRIEEKKAFESAIKSSSSENKFENDYISISSLDKVDIIYLEQILFCKSDGRYTTFYLNNNNQIVACKNLGSYEDFLPYNSFIRVHHSYIINIAYIKSINKKHGYSCEMKNGVIIPVSKRKQDFVINILTNKIK